MLSTVVDYAAEMKRMAKILLVPAQSEPLHLVLLRLQTNFA